MSAFLIVHATIKEPEKYRQYAEKAAVVLAEYGGAIKLRGKMQQVLAGSHPHSSTAIIEFPSPKAIEDWYASPAYQALIALREEAGDMNIISYETMN